MTTNAFMLIELITAHRK